MDRKQLLEGWKVKRLGEIASINYGYTAKASSENIGPKLLRITDIQNDKVDWSSVPYCPVDEADFQKYKLIDQDIVFARTGATTGKSYLVSNPPESVAASYLIRLRIKDSTISPQFISKFFQTSGYWKSVSSGISGSAQGGFNASKLSELVVKIPPIDEQKRIMAILDEAFEGIDQAISNTEKNLANARELFDSFLNKIFTEKGDGWEEASLENLSERITKGSSPKWQGINYVDEPGILFVTSENVGENQMLFDKKKYVEEYFNEKDSKSILVYGDVLTNIVGASIGRTAIYDREEIANINQAVCLIRCQSNKLLNKYLCYLLNSPYFRQILHDNEVNNARANLSLGFFRGLQIPLQLLNEQASIFFKIYKFFIETQRLETIYRQKLAALNELKQSILQKAFTGQLTSKNC
jgi:type I restriction enzyme S subunit